MRLKVGLLSDTHGYLDPTIFEHFADCDELWHAGDIGEGNLLESLKKFKPLRVVFGNIDNITLQHILPEDLWMDCEGLIVWMTHIGGAPPNYNPRIVKKLKEKVPNVFICGHSHILRLKAIALENLADRIEDKLSFGHFGRAKVAGSFW